MHPILLRALGVMCSFGRIKRIEANFFNLVSFLLGYQGLVKGMYKRNVFF